MSTGTPGSSAAPSRATRWATSCAAQFYAAALKAHPEIPEEIGQGKFETLHGWLRENIYRHGRKFTAAEVVERATGGPLTIEPYIQYLKNKYGALYTL